MMDEARLEETEHGKVAVSEGWFVLNASEAEWLGTDRFGKGCRFEGKTRFPEIGINIRVMEPGQPACLYHRENAQENFFVLSGECLLIVEGEERRLRAGDFVHCPAGTNHVFVGAGDGPCAVLMVGYRPKQEELCYPVSEVAARYGASAEKETPDPRVAYGDLKRMPISAVWPLDGGN